MTSPIVRGKKLRDPELEPHPALSAAARIAELRRAIDGVNEEILEALERRGRLVLRLMELKIRVGKPVIDPVREREMLDRLAGLARGPFYPGDIQRIFRAIINSSRGLARRLINGAD